jgi:hypothetical protein
MQKTINSVLQNPAARALILIVLIIPLSVYLGTSPVRRGFCTTRASPLMTMFGIFSARFIVHKQIGAPVFAISNFHWRR